MTNEKTFCESCLNYSFFGDREAYKRRELKKQAQNQLHPCVRSTQSFIDFFNLSSALIRSNSKQATYTQRQPIKLPYGRTRRLS